MSDPMPDVGGPDPANLVETMRLEAQRNGGAGWLSAIAGFSLINLVVLAVGGGISFIIGLGVTQVIDGLCQAFAQQMEGRSGLLLRVAGGTLTFGIAGLFLLFGGLARRGHLWAFIVAMILYAADGVIFLLFQDWLSVGFHVFALFMIFQGVAAQLKLNRLNSSGPAFVTPAGPSA